MASIGGGVVEHFIGRKRTSELAEDRRLIRRHTRVSQIEVAGLRGVRGRQS